MSKSQGSRDEMDKAVETLKKVATQGIITSINIQLRILEERGVEILDFDNPERELKQLQTLGGKVYFLAPMKE